MDLHNLQTGKKGEDIATRYLLQNGFTLQARNWRHRHYEVDILASKNKLLHIIEVKTRTSLQFGYPEEGIDRHKMQYLKNAAAVYQYLHPQWKYIQFDAIAITLENDLVKEVFFIEDIYF
jgi:putative endonuclease